MCAASCIKRVHADEVWSAESIKLCHGAKQQIVGGAAYEAVTTLTAQKCKFVYLASQPIILNAPILKTTFKYYARVTGMRGAAYFVRTSELGGR